MDIEQAFAAAWRQHQAGQLKDAEAGYREILSNDPAQAEVLYNLGTVLRALGRPDEAVAAYEQALSQRPRFPAAINNLGEVFESMGRLDDAEDLYRHALLLTPDSANLWNNLGGVLKDLGRVDEGIACLQRAHELEPDNARLHSNLVFTLHFSPRQDASALLAAARDWARLHANRLGPTNLFHAHDRSPHRRLRIGYVSGHFRNHCQALYLTPLLSSHDRIGHEIFAYSDTRNSDGITERLRASVDVWRKTADMDDDRLAELIRSDGIDVLVDLTLHMAGHRLGVFARKPAPVQITWLGYPGTTGIGAIDYRFTDTHLDPPGTRDDLYAERSVRLPDSFWCYDPLTDQPAVNALPAGRSGPITFGCLNNFCKVNDAVLELWSRVARAVPDSRFLLLAPPGTARARAKAKLGVTADRIEFVAYQPRDEYLRHYQRIDIGLDTFPYQGHTTSLDAWWMGVPVVSLAGNTAVARASLSLSANLGLSDLVAMSPADYVREAVALAGDRERLADLRAGLRHRLTQSPLMDHGRFARNVEQAYRILWLAWCQTASKSPTSVES